MSTGTPLVTETESAGGFNLILALGLAMLLIGGVLWWWFARKSSGSEDDDV
jgi:hypothetical protein